MLDLNEILTKESSIKKITENFTGFNLHYQDALNKQELKKNIFNRTIPENLKFFFNFINESRESEQKLQEKINAEDPNALYYINSWTNVCSIYTTKKDFKILTDWELEVNEFPCSDTYECILKVLKKQYQDLNFKSIFAKKRVNLKSWMHYQNNENYGDISFFGATKKVGASCFNLELNNYNLFLDAGYDFKVVDSEQVAWPPILPELMLKNLDAVLLSHGHFDHCAFLPEIYKEGFRGPTYCTLGTLLNYFEVCSQYIKISKCPRYNYQDLLNTLPYFNVIKCARPMHLTPFLTFTLLPASHTLGSTMIELIIKRKNGKNYKFLYTGDYRCKSNPFFPPVLNIKKNYEAILTEGTYGMQSRSRTQKEDLDELIEFIRTIKENQGFTLLPCFSNSRLTQLIYLLLDYLKPDQIISSKVLLNLIKMLEDCKTQIIPLFLEKLKNNLAKFQIANNFTDLRFKFSPSVIVAASGMLEGGHATEIFKNINNDSNSGVFFTGFVSKNSLGGIILNNKEIKKINFFDKYTNRNTNLTVNLKIGSNCLASAHSSGKEIAAWLKNKITHNTKIFLVHGIETNLNMLANYLRNTLKVEVVVPNLRNKLFLY